MRTEKPGMEREMTLDAIIGKFLDDEALLEGGNAAVREVVAELGEEGVTVYRTTVSNVQTVTRHVLAMQRAGDCSQIS
jgi:hypothetical protein